MFIACEKSLLVAFRGISLDLTVNGFAPIFWNPNYMILAFPTRVVWAFNVFQRKNEWTLTSIDNIWYYYAIDGILSTLLKRRFFQRSHYRFLTAFRNTFCTF
jgi:hypothetical protein